MVASSPVGTFLPKRDDKGKPGIVSFELLWFDAYCFIVLVFWEYVVLITD